MRVPPPDGTSLVIFSYKNEEATLFATTNFLPATSVELAFTSLLYTSVLRSSPCAALVPPVWQPDRAHLGPRILVLISDSFETAGPQADSAKRERETRRGRRVIAHESCEPATQGQGKEHQLPEAAT